MSIAGHFREGWELVSIHRFNDSPSSFKGSESIVPAGALIVQSDNAFAVYIPIRRPVAHDSLREKAIKEGKDVPGAHSEIGKSSISINRIRSDNRIENLRDAITHNNNCGNQSHQTGRSSKYKGVCWDKNRNKWIVAIKVNRKAKYLGRYKNEENAARAYNAAASIYFGEFANINEV